MPSSALLVSQGPRPACWCRAHGLVPRLGRVCSPQVTRVAPTASEPTTLEPARCSYRVCAPACPRSTAGEAAAVRGPRVSLQVDLTCRSQRPQQRRSRAAKGKLKTTPAVECLTEAQALNRFWVDQWGMQGSPGIGSGVRTWIMSAFLIVRKESLFLKKWLWAVA